MAKSMAELRINNGKQVFAAIREQSLKGREKLDLKVGYSAQYAVYVHEDLTTSHRTGEAKFLSNAAKRVGPMMKLLIRESLLMKRSLEQGMLRAGALLLAESQRRVPVDTGYLRASGYVKVR